MKKAKMVELTDTHQHGCFLCRKVWDCVDPACKSAFSLCSECRKGLCPLTNARSLEVLRRIMSYE